MRMVRTACALLILAAGASAQEKFEPKVEKGDKWTIRSEASLILNMKVKPEGQDEMRERNLKSKRSEVKHVEVLEVSKGKPSSWKASYPESKMRTGEASSSDADLTVAATDLEGKDFEVNDKEVTPEDSSDEVKAMVGTPEGFWLLLPKKGDVKLNDSWTLEDPSFATAIIRGTDESPEKATVTVTLTEITNQNGTRVAVLGIVGQLTVASKQDIKAVWDFSGTLRYDLDAQMPMSLEIMGEAKSFEGNIRDAKGLPAGTIDAKGSTFRIEVFYSPKAE